MDFDFPEAKEFLKKVIPDASWGSEHLKKTPYRFANMLYELTRPEEFTFTTFPNANPYVDEMVTCTDIPFYTFCAHHILPFFGVAHIAYVPDNRIAGLSKLPRTVQHFCRGLNVQEVLTQQIANFLELKLRPVGVAVVMQAEHLCATMRGARSPGMRTTTSALKGCFRDESKKAREEFLSLVRNK